MSAEPTPDGGPSAHDLELARALQEEGLVRRFRNEMRYRAANGSPRIDPEVETEHHVWVAEQAERWRYAIECGGAWGAREAIAHAKWLTDRVDREWPRGVPQQERPTT